MLQIDGFQMVQQLDDIIEQSRFDIGSLSISRPIIFMYCAQNGQKFKQKVKDLDVQHLVEKPVNYANLKQVM